MILEWLKKYMPAICPVCGAPVMIDIKNTAYKCSKFICKIIVFIKKYKEIFGLTNVGEVKMQELFEKLRHGMAFENWVIDRFNEVNP